MRPGPRFPWPARLREDSGQGLVEYALLMLLMVFVSIAILQLLGVAVLDLFVEAGDAVNEAVGG